MPAPSRQSVALASNVGIVFISLVVMLVTGVGVKVVIGNYLSTDDFGVYSLSITIYILITLMGTIGLPATITHFTAKYRDEAPTRRRYFRFALWIMALLGIAFGGGFILFADLFGQTFSMPDLPALILIIGCSLPSVFISQLYRAQLQGMQRMRALSMLDLLRSALIFVLTLVLILLDRGLIGTVFALFIADMGATLAYVVAVERHEQAALAEAAASTAAAGGAAGSAAAAESKRLAPRTRSRFLAFAGKILLSNSANVVNLRQDMIFIGFFLTEGDTGVYAIALLFITMLLMIPQSVSKVTYPLLSAHHAKNERQRIDWLVNISIRYTMLIMVLVGLILPFFAGWVIRLFFPNRPDYLGAVLPLSILLIGVVFLAGITAVGFLFTSHDRPDLGLHITLVQLGFNLAFNILLIPVIGLLGAAIATTVSNTVRFVLSVVLARRSLSVNIELRPIIAISGVYLPLVTLNLFLSDPGAWVQTGLVAGGATVFILLMFAIKVVTRRELRILKATGLELIRGRFTVRRSA